MSRSTTNAVERNGIHVGKDGLSYALECIVEEESVRGCAFCGSSYRNIGAQVQTECGLELCPACITSGPQIVARKARKRRSLKEAAEVFSRLANFAEIPGGVLALKIAEAHTEVERRCNG
jgi:ribose 1,5-bisphosphokinase PhnN